jgi:phage-related protein
MSRTNVFDEASTAAVTAIVDQTVEFALNCPQEVFEVILLARALQSNLDYWVGCGKELEETGAAPVVDNANTGSANLNMAEDVFLDTVDIKFTFKQMKKKYGIDMLEYFKYRRFVDVFTKEVTYAIDNTGPRSHLKV